ncbi:nicotinamide riboside transporter PnuC [Duganella sp. Leaf126]|uniref:nicotinamide riboside transporter PnuC n=1 Tax=Duganella sp. Leaf126 TaxID=1736266 RepID=UPI0009EBBF65|nr:nicotinamide riboside transporter PnuC [Duganella sp. Leaf126]
MTSVLEIAANAVMTVSIVLAGRNNVHSWWLGIVGCGLFAVLFYDSHLYADVTLQGFFIVTCVIGWWRWLRGSTGAPLPITHAQPRALIWMGSLGLAATAIYGLLLQAYTSAYAPFLDSGVLMFSVIAQLLLMGRRLQTWQFWLLVNTIAVPLYASRGLYLTSVLYGAYWFNALASWFFWRRKMREAALQSPA